MYCVGLTIQIHSISVFCVCGILVICHPSLSSEVFRKSKLEGLIKRDCGGTAIVIDEEQSSSSKSVVETATATVPV